MPSYEALSLLISHGYEARLYFSTRVNQVEQNANPNFKSVSQNSCCWSHELNKINVTLPIGFASGQDIFVAVYVFPEAEASLRAG